MDAQLNQNLLDFIDRSPSMYHAIASIGKELETAGFLPLQETEPWHPEFATSEESNKRKKELLRLRKSGK